MRVLFTTSNWAGHYFCMVPLGWALQAAGHEVRVACTPEQATTISTAGLVPVPVLTTPDMMMMARLGCYLDAVEGRRTLPGLPLHPVTGEPVHSLDDFDLAVEGPRLGAEIASGISRSFDAAVELARAWRPDLVCYDLTADEGALVAEVTGVPGVWVTPGLYGSMEDSTGPDLGPFDTSGSFPRYGLGTWDRSRIRYVLDPSPDAASPPFGTAVRRTVRYVPYNGPGAYPQWALHRPDAGRICVIWGSSAVGTAAHVPSLRAALDTAVSTGAEVVLTTNPAQVAALGELPPSVRVLHNFPLHLLLATSDAVIHHGSGNPLMTAAVAGVPQVALAMNDEQIPVSRRMAGTGAVIALPGLAATPDEVRAAVLAVTGDPAYRAAAGNLREELMARPSPAGLVEPLEELAAGGSFAP
ncbi:nucleotide disphospho-sugar-binding domain-containing protein [Actinoplanes sp. NPDC049548]|uniref:nucleotide disphospho-sugar-binding domain-containing protein n=1 Tax=Actinoplanes sp. NPDC049548 TaxID=3155152 RepID=UPI00342A9E8E